MGLSAEEVVKLWEKTLDAARNGDPVLDLVVSDEDERTARAHFTPESPDTPLDGFHNVPLRVIATGSGRARVRTPQTADEWRAAYRKLAALTGDLLASGATVTATLAPAPGEPQPELA